MKVGAAIFFDLHPYIVAPIGATDAYTVKNDLLKIRKNLLTPTSAKMLLFQDVFLLILVCPTTN